MDAQKRAQARVGTTLDGKWLLHGLIGCGGMAAVYEASHRNGKRAALKVLHPQLSVHDDFRQRFLREGYLANTVGHPGAVSVLDDATDDEGSVYLVMELLVGETLGARWERLGKQMRVQEVLPIAGAILDVLEAAHGKGIVHRDVKPDNVFLTEEGVVKLLDFGVARLREASTGIQSTASGVTMGTPVFMAPEQARGRWKEVDARSDLWAVGAMIWTCLTGRYVHAAETGNEVLLRAMTQPAPRFSVIAPDAPASLCALIDRALESDREKRYESAAVFHEALRAVLDETRGGTTTVTVAVDASVGEAMGATVLSDSRPEARGPSTAPKQTLAGTSASAVAPSLRMERTRMAALLTLGAIAVATVTWRVAPRAPAPPPIKPAESVVDPPTRELPTASASLLSPVPAPAALSLSDAGTVTAPIIATRKARVRATTPSPNHAATATPTTLPIPIAPATPTPSVDPYDLRQ